MVCSWWDHPSKPSVCPLKRCEGLVCLRWGLCVPVPAGSCWGGSSGFVWEHRCLQGASLGALPRLCLFSPPDL